MSATFDIELKWHNLTHACYSIFEDGQEVGQVVILAEHEAEFEALFDAGMVEALMGDDL